MAQSHSPEDAFENSSEQLELESWLSYVVALVLIEGDGLRRRRPRPVLLSCLRVFRKARSNPSSCTLGQPTVKFIVVAVGGRENEKFRGFCDFGGRFSVSDGTFPI